MQTVRLARQQTRLTCSLLRTLLVAMAMVVLGAELVLSLYRLTLQWLGSS